MLPGHVVYSFITLFRFSVCWFVLQSTAFCSALGKVRNQSPGEQPDVDTDKLCLSLSICLNGSDTRVGSLEEASEPRCICCCCCCCLQPWKRKVYSLRVHSVKFARFQSKFGNVWNEREYSPYWPQLLSVLYKSSTSQKVIPQ